MIRPPALKRLYKGYSGETKVALLSRCWVSSNAPDLPITGLWLARNEGMDPHSNHVFPITVVSMFYSILSFPANQWPDNSKLSNLVPCHKGDC